MAVTSSTTRILTYICIFSIVKPVQPDNSKDCEWCVTTNGKSCSKSSRCRVKYYYDQEFARVKKSKCFEIQDFNVQRVYGNFTKDHVSFHDACSLDVPKSELGIALSWTIRGDYVKKLKHFVMSISKIYVTTACVTRDTVEIAKPTRVKRVSSEKQVRFRFVYKGSEERFCLNFGDSYTVSMNTGTGCPISKMSTMFPEKFCPEESPPPVNNRISYTTICVLSVVIFLVVLIGILSIVLMMKRRRKNEDCESKVNMLLLLNPEISEGKMMEQINTMATKIGRLPSLNVDCNFWNRSQSQYDWVNNALQLADIVIIICIEDRTEKPTADNFDIWISRLLTGNFSRDIVVVHPPDFHHHDRCPFNRENYHVMRIYGDVEKDTQVLKKEIWKIAKGRPARREASPLIPVSYKAESEPP